MTIDPASGVIAWTPAATHVPSVNVTVQVVDGKSGSATQSFVIAVAAAPPPNQSPTITSYPVTSATEGQPYSYDVDASDPNAGDILTYSLTQAPGGMTIDPSSGVISWVPLASAPTPAQVIVVATDNHATVATQSFEITVSPAALGRGLVGGWVFDDTTGLPIQNATAQLLDAAGQPTTTLPVNSDSLGRFRLSAVSGPGRIRVTKEGYTSADLAVTVVDGRRVEPDDARLTPLNPSTAVVSSVAGGFISRGVARLTFDPASLTQDRALTLTNVGVQGLIRRLPLGWAPLAVLDVVGGSQPFGGAGLLSVRPVTMPANGRDVILARWHETTGEWISAGLGSRSADGTTVEGNVAGPGQFVFAVADPSPNTPSIPSAGAALTGVAPRPPPSAQLTLNPAPRILFAQAGARSTVAATALPSEPLPSGTPLEIDLAESFTFASGSTLHPMPGRRRLALYSLAGAPPNAMVAGLAVVPSRVLTPFSLREGAIDLAGRLPANPEAPRGRVFSGTGGEFAATSGERVVVPAGASPEDLPVDLIPIPADEFPLAVPAGHTLFRAFVLDLHGAPLSRDLQVTIPGAGTVPDGTVALVVQLVDVGEATRLVLVAIARSQAGSLVTTVDPLGSGAVLLPGLRSEGRYAVLFASGSFGYVTGSVTAADGSLLAGALLDVGNSPIAALSDAAGRYTLLVPAGSVDVRVTNPANGDSAVVNAQVAGSFSVTNRPAALGASPPVIVALTPGNGAAGVPLGSSITVTFSEPVDPASVTPDAVRLASGASTVAGTVALAPGNAALTFSPASLLQSHTRTVFDRGGDQGHRRARARRAVPLAVHDGRRHAANATSGRYGRRLDSGSVGEHDDHRLAGHRRSRRRRHRPQPSQQRVDDAHTECGWEFQRRCRGAAHGSVGDDDPRCGGERDDGAGRGVPRRGWQRRRWGGRRTGRGTRRGVRGGPSRGAAGRDGRAPRARGPVGVASGRASRLSVRRRRPARSRRRGGRGVARHRRSSAIRCHGGRADPRRARDHDTKRACLDPGGSRSSRAREVQDGITAVPRGHGGRSVRVLQARGMRQLHQPDPESLRQRADVGAFRSGRNWKPVRLHLGCAVRRPREPVRHAAGGSRSSTPRPISCFRK